MLTRGDDYPIHQTPEPIAHVGTHQNFYDRYYFNGYDREGETFFSVALGVYPYRNIMDASFSIISDGIQHNIHASRVMDQERMDTRVGPISIHVVEPLKTLQIRIDPNEYGISGNITFKGRVKAFEEPRFQYKSGNRILFDYTRLTQNGTYTGQLNIKGKEVPLGDEHFFGTRDRSWGVRPIGDFHAERLAPMGPPQYFWMWAPLQFDDCCTFFATNEYSDGNPWHRSAMISVLGDTDPEMMVSSNWDLVFKPGTRHVKTAVLEYRTKDARDIRISLTPRFQFYMSGLGYSNPEWGHAVYKGDDVIGYESYDLKAIDENEVQFLHVQAFVAAVMTGLGDNEKKGFGVLEQTFIGPHAKAGFKDVLDMAP
jgi:hypothetical protein